MAARLRAESEHQMMAGAHQMISMNPMQQQVSSFDGQLNDMTVPEDFQAWMDDNMDFLNNDWLAFGAL